MKGKNRLVTAIVGVVLIAALVFAGCAPKPPTPPKAPVKWGFLGDLTGPVSLSCVWMDRAAAALTAHYNKKGGIKGHPIEFRFLDTGFDPARTITGYKALKDWGAVTIGNIGTRPGLAVKDMHIADKIPGVTNSMSAAVVYPPAYLYCHYVWITQGGFLGLKWILEKQWDYGKMGPLKIGIVAMDDPLGRFNAPCIKKYAEKLGEGKIQVVATEYIPMPVITAEAQVKRFQDAGAHWVFNCLTSDMYAGTLVKDAKRLGTTYKWMHQTSALHTTTFPAAGGALEGHYNCYVWAIPEDKGWGLDLMKELWTTYEKKPLEDLYTKYWETFTGFGFHLWWVPYKAIEMALDAVGYDKLTPEAVKVHGFDKIKDLDTGGVSPGISFADYPGDRIGVGKSRILQVKGGRFVKITDWMKHLPESDDARLLVEEWSK